MARYRLYCIGASGNSYKVALYLNCAGLDWQPVGVDFAGGQMRDAGWRAATNEMGEVPVLEVEGRRLSQSGAILNWLAETTGKFAPADEQRIEALRWILFDNHKFTGSYAPHRFLGVMTPEPSHPSLMAYFRGGSRMPSPSSTSISPIGRSCWAIVSPSSTSRWRDTSSTRHRRRASISRRNSPTSTPGGSGSAHCRAGSRPMS